MRIRNGLFLAAYAGVKLSLLQPAHFCKLSVAVPESRIWILFMAITRDLRMCCRFILVAVFFLCARSVGQAQIIGTLIGNGTDITAGEGGPARCGSVAQPVGVFVNARGDVYFTNSNSVRKIDASTGIVNRIAGADNAGSSGDGGPAINALLNSPRSVCEDASGNIYIAEFGSHRIRMISVRTGIISTVVGTGELGFSGDGGPAIRAKMNFPHSIAIDANSNLYIADYRNHRIRKVNLITGIISTVAGNGTQGSSGDRGPAVTAGLASPSSVAVDAAGNLYIAQEFTGTSRGIRKVTAATGIITTLVPGGSDNTGDDGPANQARIILPMGICVDPMGNVFVADNRASVIRKINQSTGIITRFAGIGQPGFGGDNGPAMNSLLNSPIGICSDNSGNIYVADSRNYRIRKIHVNLTSPPNNGEPRISITSNSTDVCSATPIVFTATVTNGSPNMIYQWYRNSINVGSNITTYSPTSLNNNDTISCMLTAATCGGVKLVSSNKIVVKGTVTPKITIQASATNICPGTPVKFTATSTDAGTQPSYQWLLNGTPVGNNSLEYTNSNLNSADVVNCLLNVDPTFNCANPRSVESEKITISIDPNLLPAISIQSNALSVCPGGDVQLTATLQNAGTEASYQWQVNGTNVNSDGTALNLQDLANPVSVVCILTPSPNGCSSAPVISNEVGVQIHPVPTILLSPADTIVYRGTQVQLEANIVGSFQTISWSPASAVMDPGQAFTLTVPIQASTEYRATVIDINGCEVSGSLKVRIYQKLNMPNAFSPNGDGKNEVFRIPQDVSFELQEFSIFDRWGNKIFSTKNISQGWDGKVNGNLKPSGTYVYSITGKEGSQTVQFKGSLVLIY